MMRNPQHTVARLFSIVVLLLPFLQVSGQSDIPTPRQQKIDSLNKILTKTTADTGKIKLYNQLSEVWIYIDPDTAIDLCQRALQLARTNNLEEAKVQSLSNLGVYNRYTGDHIGALNHYKQALRILQKLESKGDTTRFMRSQQASIFNNLGNIYRRQGSYPKALNYYFKALQTNQQLGNKESQSINLGNIGIVYAKQGSPDTTIRYFTQALQISKELNNKSDMARHMGNLGLIWLEQHQYKKAWKYFRKALNVERSLGNRSGNSKQLSNLSQLYLTYFKNDTGQTPLQLSMEGFRYKLSSEQVLDTALTTEQRSLALRQKLDNKEGMIYSYSKIGEILYHQWQLVPPHSPQKSRLPEKIKSYYLNAYQMASQLDLIPRKYEIAGKLYNFYKTMQQTDSALAWLEIHNQLKDSIFNQEKMKAIGRQEAQYEWKLKMVKQRKKHDKQQAITRERNKRQQTIIYAISGGLLLILVFLGLLYNRFRVTRQQKNVIEQQKQLVDEKNREITSSINYAQRIQSAMLKARRYLDRQFPNNYFILFQPKEAVSGDFYWAYQEGNRFFDDSYEEGDRFFWTVADCTGHGVPGAFMSMIGNMLLNEGAVVKKMTEPGPILDELKRVIVDTLKQPGEEEDMYDGMDMALCVLNTKTNQLKFAGAKNPLYLIRENADSDYLEAERVQEDDNYTLFEFKGDPQPVGFEPLEPEPFQQTELQLQKGDVLYTFSDGFADQFGGKRGKKFTYQRFRELLLDLQGAPMGQQKDRLEQTLQDWMEANDEEQIDDICVMGVRIS